MTAHVERKHSLVNDGVRIESVKWACITPGCPELNKVFTRDMDSITAARPVCSTCFDAPVLLTGTEGRGKKDGDTYTPTRY